MFEELARDTTSGATALTRRAVELLSETLSDSRANDPGEFWNELQAACRELVGTQREMAPLINLAGKALSSAERLVLSGVGAATLKRATVLELSTFVNEMDEEIESLAREGAAALPACSKIATLSASECVRAVLEGAVRSGRTLTVIASESRPAMEGTAQAKRLGALGIDVLLVTDDALPDLIREVDLVLVGADRVSQGELVGKTGVHAAAVAAEDAGVPFLAAATMERFISEVLAGPGARQGSPNDPADELHSGDSVGDDLFEPIPMSLVAGILTGDGFLSPEQISVAVSRKPVPPALLRVLFDRTPPSGL
jgi:ribose 1,5-bisphosphate isomerase